MDLEHFFAGIQEEPETLFERAQPWLKVAAGGMLAAYGISRKSVPGAGVAVVGGYLVYSGLGSFARGRFPRLISVERSFLIPRPAHDLYRFWRDFENLPRFTRNLKSVKMTGARHAHIEAYAPMGLSISWDTEITEDRENEFIAWQSLPGAMIPNQGSVEFRQAGSADSTEVRVEVRYELPAGQLGAAFARMLGRNPESQVEEDLLRFERLMTMENVPTTEGLTAGRRTPWIRMMEATREGVPETDERGA